MECRLKGKLNQLNQNLLGNLNIYTMETGDGRDIELAIVDEYICWRRVNDTKWIQLIPLSELEGKEGKSAYKYAVEGGYTGTEAEFAAKLAQEIPKIDPTLIHRGQSADSKATGDALRSLSEEISDCIKAPTTAEVGQTIVVKSIGDDGKPTEWEPVTLPEQMQADWNQNDETTADYIKNKPLIATDDDVLDFLVDIGAIIPVTNLSGEILISPSNEIYSL